MTDGPEKPPLGAAVVGAPAPDLLGAFLSGRDCPCPHCGYNLRGATAPACPECGRALELAIRVPVRLSGYAALICGALAWVMLASGMNAARQMHANYQTASVSWQIFIAGGATTTVTTTVVDGVVTRSLTSTSSGVPFPLSFDADPDVDASAPAGSSPAGGAGNFAESSPGDAPGAVTLAGPPTRGPVRPASSGPVWSQVAAIDWFWLGWWSTLGLSAAAGLMRLWFVMRVRPSRAAAASSGTRVMAWWAAVCSPSMRAIT